MQWKAPCPECGKRVRMELLMKHVKTAHRGIHNIKCQQCGQGFQSQKGLRRHVMVHHVGTFAYCRASNKTGVECGKILHSEEGLINHVECKHMAAPEVACPECSTQVPPCYLLHHITSIHTTPGQVECPVKGCEVRKGDEEGLKHHVDTDHLSLGLEWCHQCAQFVMQMEEHWKLQHVVKLPFNLVYGLCKGQVCPLNGCDFMATSSIHLEGHVRRKHKKVRVNIKSFSNVKSEECGKKVDDIGEHVQFQLFNAIHKAFWCELCEKFFSSKLLLRVHKNTHLKKKVKCDECGVMVKKMRQHKRFVHKKI